MPNGSSSDAPVIRPGPSARTYARTPVAPTNSRSGPDAGSNPPPAPEVRAESPTSDGSPSAQIPSSPPPVIVSIILQRQEGADRLHRHFAESHRLGDLFRRDRSGG